MKCPLCDVIYTPKHASKAEAMATQDKEAREQWISGTCSTACWDTHMRAPDEDEIEDDGLPELTIYCRAGTPPCSAKVQLSQQRNACPSCGVEYSRSGQALAPVKEDA